MLTKRSLPVLIALTVLLSGCVRAVYNPTPTPPLPTVTPPVPFDLVPAVTPTPALPPSVYLQPSVIDLIVGEPAVVSIQLDSAIRLNRLHLEMIFDPACVQVIDDNPAAEGVQITPGNIPQAGSVVQNLVSAGGWITYEVALGAGEAVDGSGIAASITFQGVAECASPLLFENVAAFDPAGQPLDITALADGLITVAGTAAAQPTAPPAVQPTPPSAVRPTAPPAATPAANQGVYYIVQRGENLYRIGLKFGLTSEAIAAANGIGDPNQVSAGTMILIPIAPPRGRLGYYVQPGDTLYSIANRFGTTVEQIAAWSGLSNYTIAAGQILTVSP